jgi:hypothetical protein
MVWVAILVANLSLLGVIGNLVFTPGPLMIALKLVGVAIYSEAASIDDACHHTRVQRLI